jgi:hypothetical protein
MRPMLSPRLTAMNADSFVADEPSETTVDLAAHRGDSTLNELDLGARAAGREGRIATIAGRLTPH